MADVGKVGKDRNLPEPSGPKKKKGHDSEKFKEMMKVGKVRETDPEEQRKRKQQAEAEEEEKAKQKSDVPSQGLKGEPKEPTLYTPKEGKGALGATEGKEPLPPDDSLPSPPSPPPFFSPPGEEESYPSPDVQPEGAQPSQRKRKKVSKREAPPKTEKKAPSKKTEKPKKTKEAVQAPAPKKGEKIPPKKEEFEALKVEGGKVPYEKSTEPKVEKKKEKPLAEEVVPPLPPGAWEATKAPEKEEKEKEIPGEKPVTEPITPPPLAPMGPSAAQAPPPLVAPFAHLPPQIAQVFERMVGVMTVMTETGMTQTTINLDNPQFANSAFFGSQIVISEFSTAPKAFNIELLGNQQALDLFNNNAEELVAAFQAGNYNFKVNRIDTGYLPAVGEAKRKQVRRVKRKKSGGM